MGINSLTACPTIGIKFDKIFEIPPEPFYVFFS